MRSPLPRSSSFEDFRVVRLGVDGALLDGDTRVTTPSISYRLEEVGRIPPRATDVFVFVHGWRTSGTAASASSARLFSAVWDLYREQRERYPRLDGFRPLFISVQWPSESSVLPTGYRRIRDRAHAMTTNGWAAHILAQLLGYLDKSRDDAHTRPHGPDILRAAGGQYLHCAGHSFGCRFLGEAILHAANPPARPVLAWPWHSRFPFAIDSFLGFQMATSPDVFEPDGCFAALTSGEAPIAGPVVLTKSNHDRALSSWHRRMEGVPGIGAVGATGAKIIALKRMGEDYAIGDFGRPTNVDCGWLYRRGCKAFQGAHSDIWYPESIHLLLSLANLSR